MPDVISCPRCRQSISRRLPDCRYCGERLGEVPQKFDIPLLESLRDEDIAEMIWVYCCEFFTKQMRKASLKEFVAALPSGLRAGYCLYDCAGNANSGGSEGWLTGLTGELTEETLEAARLIEADACVELLLKILKINAQLEREIPSYRDRWLPAEQERRQTAEERREFNRLSKPHFDALYALDKESVEMRWTSWLPQLIEFARTHPDQFVHDRSSKS